MTDTLAGAELEAELDTDTDSDQEPDATHAEAATARRIAGYLIIGGCVIAGLCLAFIVWEQWQANRAVLESLSDPLSADLAAYPVASPPGRTQAPDPGPQGQQGPNPGPEAAEGFSPPE